MNPRLLYEVKEIRKIMGFPNEQPNGDYLKIGDEVILRGNSTVTDVLKVVGIGELSEDFLMTYIVEFPNGQLGQYEETELSLNPGFTLDKDR